MADLFSESGSITGDGLCFYINEKALACETSCDFSMTVDMKSVSPYSAGGGGWQYQVPGIKSWQINIGANFLTHFKEADFKTIIQAMINGTPMQIAMHTGIGYSPSFFLGGEAYASNIGLTSPRAELVSYTTTFVGNGPLIFTSEASEGDFWRIINANPAPSDKPYYFQTTL